MGRCYFSTLYALFYLILVILLVSVFVLSTTLRPDNFTKGLRGELRKKLLIQFIIVKGYGLKVSERNDALDKVQEKPV